MLQESTIAQKITNTYDPRGNSLCEDSQICERDEMICEK